jgi:uncharacterized protein (DUF608 family)
MYHNKFSGNDGFEAMLKFVSTPAVRETLNTESTSWHAPILSSTMPTFLQFKLINSTYTMYTNALLNKAGQFSTMEGYGCSGLNRNVSLEDSTCLPRLLA